MCHKINWAVNYNTEYINLPHMKLLEALELHCSCVTSLKSMYFLLIQDVIVFILLACRKTQFFLHFGEKQTTCYTVT